MIKLFKFGISALAFASMVATGSAQEQALPQLGLAANATFQQFRVEHINIADRNAVIEIPLFSLREPGGLSLSFSARMNSNPWTATMDCYSGQTICNIYYYTRSLAFQNGPNDSSLGPDINRDQGWFVPGPQLRETQAYAGSFNGTPTYTERNILEYVAYDSTGAPHKLFYDADDSSKLRSIDGTGLMMQIPNVSKPYDYQSAKAGPSYGNYIAAAVVDPKGISFFPDGTQSDQDGNTIHPTSAGLEDPLGRILLNAQAMTASTTGCPDLSTQAANQPLVGSSSWTVPGPNGNVTFLTCYARVTVRTNFWNNNGRTFVGTSAPSTCGDGDGSACNYEQIFLENDFSQNVVQSIVLPDKTYWGFIYESQDPNDTTNFSYGVLKKLINPLGGSIAYEYESSEACWWPGPWTLFTGNNVWYAPHLKSRTESDGRSNTYTWNYSRTNPVFGGQNVIRVTDPNHNDTDYSFTQGGGCSSILTAESHYQGTAPTTLLSTSTYTQSEWPSPQISSFFPEDGEAPLYKNQTQTTSVNGLSVRTSKQYSSQGTVRRWECSLDNNAKNLCIPLALVNVATISPTVTTKSSDVGTVTTIMPVASTDPTSEYWKRNLLTLTTSVDTTSDFDSEELLSEMAYDEPGYVSDGTSSGHLTSLKIYPDSSSSLTSHVYWNSNGTVNHSTDDRLNTVATYEYGALGGGYFPTSVQDAVGNVTGYGYDLSSGLVTSITDPNGNITNTTYEAGGRAIDTGTYDKSNNIVAETTACYTLPSSSGADQTIPASCAGAGSRSVVIATRQDASVWQRTEQHVDALGRVIESDRQTSSGVIMSRTEYDGVDNVVSQTLPSSNGTNSAMMSFTYDSLGRKLLASTSAGTATTVSQNCYNGLQLDSRQTVCQNRLSVQYTGQWVDSADENGHRRQASSDGMGRLRSIVEAADNTGPLTQYTYSTLGNLKTVAQKGTSADTARGNREFTYDNLSRLISASNTEAGGVTYSYTSDSGQLCSGNPTLPCKKTDARSVSTTFRYDKANRLIAKEVQGIASCYLYDSYAGAAPADARGRLTAEWTQHGVCPTSPAQVPSAVMTRKIIGEYDALGRLKSQRTQSCNGVTCTAEHLQSFSYDYASNLTSFDDGRSGGRTFSLGYDSAGRFNLLQTPVTGSSNPLQLFEVKDFDPFGPSKAYVGGVMTWKNGYDVRGRTTSGSAVLGLQ